MSLVEKHRRIKALGMTWHSGEHLLNFNSKDRPSFGFPNLGKDYSANIITNGNLLDESSISKLKILNIDSIQITIYGKNEEIQLEKGNLNVRYCISIH